jgi:outer membrane autotransporter protein
MLMIGGSAGLVRGDWHPRLRSARSDLDVDGYAFGLYATWFEKADQSGGWYVDFATQMGIFDFDLKTPAARIAKYDGNSLAGSLEVGHILQTGGWRIEPKARFTYLSSDVDGFLGADGLQAQANRNDRYRGRLAVRASSDMPMGNMVLTPAVTLGVSYDLKRDRGVLVGFDSLEASAPRTVAEGSAGLSLRLGNGSMIFAEGQGRLGSDYWQAGVRGGVSFRW